MKPRIKLKYTFHQFKPCEFTDTNGNPVCLDCNDVEDAFLHWKSNLENTLGIKTESKLVSWLKDNKAVV